MQIDSPYKDKTPDLVDEDTGEVFYGETKEERVVQYKPLDPNNPSLGIVAEEKTIKVPVRGETISRSGESDSKYWQPEVVYNPTGCVHAFQIIDISKREIECTKGCGTVTEFHAGINYLEENGKSFVTLKGVRYPIYL